MKKLVWLMIMLLAVSPAIALNLVANSDFADGTANWSNWGNGYWAAPSQTGAGTIAFGWTDGATIGQNTGHAIRANTTYTMTAMVKTIDDPGGQAEGVTLIFQDVTGGYVDIVRTTFLFPAEWNFGGTGEQSPWTPYSISFDSADYPDLVGHVLLVALAVSDTQEWDQYGNLFLDSVEVILEGAEEPAPVDDPEFDDPLAIATTTELSWLNPEDIDQCDVWFGDITGSDANLMNYKDGRLGATPYVITSPVAPPARQTVSLGDLSVTLEKDRQYAWAVDCYRGTGLSDPNLPALFVWTFTVTDAPLFDGHPADQIVDIGGTAEFSASFTSSDLTQVRWFKEAGETDIELINGVGGVSIVNVINGVEYDTTLTLAGVGVADEGQYYCLANSTVDAASLPANLGVKHLVAHWTLDSADYDGTYYLDTSSEDAEANNADPNGVPVFVAGVNGAADTAVTVDAANGWANAGTWNPSQYTGAVTLSFWMKWDGSAGNQNIISKSNAWDAAQSMWQVFLSGGGNLTVGRSGVNAVTSSAVAVTPNVWQYVVVTMDGTTAAIYTHHVDEAGLTLHSVSGPFTYGSMTDSTFWIGARGTSATTATEQFSGLLDDIQVFNYVKDAYAVVDMYNAVIEPDKGFCLETYPAAYDLANAATGKIFGEAGFTPDCKVDLADLAAFAASGWLSEGLYPDLP